jgi:uncharacterized lipoprotein NlpE involved in copper resistance
MKALQIICLFTLLGFAPGCKQEQKEPAVEQKEQGTLPETTADSVTVAPAADTHTSENSLDWAGVYKGSLPCTDCPGIATELTLNKDNTYSLSSQAENKEKEPRIFKGTFTWDESKKNVVTLDAEGDHLKFKVQEGCVTMLDKFGDPKQGKGNYVLGKKQ